LTKEVSAVSWNSKNESVFSLIAVYVIEIALKLSPLPLSVERKELGEAEALYSQIKQCLQQGQNNVLELTCEKVEDKKVALLTGEVLAVQMYEKTAASGGSKRPGFSF